MANEYFKNKPELYEESFNYKEIQKQVRFLTKIFRKYKAKKILDVACGHTPQGRALAKKGYEVYGIDLSTALLKLANKRAKEERIKIKLYKKDMRNFYLGKFDAAYILFSSILHLYKKEDITSHFKSIHKNLKKGGLYIIDISSLPFDSPYKEKEIKIKRDSIKTTINYQPLDKKNLIAKFSIKSFLKNKIYVNNTYTVLMFLSTKSLEKYAKETGFKVINLYSNFNSNKLKNKKDYRYIAVLKKL